MNGANVGSTVHLSLSTSLWDNTHSYSSIKQIDKETTDSSYLLVNTMSGQKLLCPRNEGGPNGRMDVCPKTILQKARKEQMPTMRPVMIPLCISPSSRRNKRSSRVQRLYGDSLNIPRQLYPFQLSLPP